MKALLIRVGADGTPDGEKWNGPVHAESGRFVYVPIHEDAVPFHPECGRRFDEVADPLTRFVTEHGAPGRWWRERIEAKRGKPMHLDPDYEHLTYSRS